MMSSFKNIFNNKLAVLSSFGSYFAFTIAEVLIVLGILGLVAEITIPSLVQDVQKQMYVASLKKFYTNFSQVLTQMMVDSNCVGDFSCLNIFSSDPDKTVVQAFSPYLKYSKAGWNNENNGYGPYTKWIVVKNLGGGINYNIFRGEVFVLNDGSVIMISDWWDMMTGCTSSSNWATSSGQICTRVSVDINGSKPPNVSGRDVFLFFVNKKGALIPSGSRAASWNWTNDKGEGQCNQSINSSSNGCSGRIIDEGWQMNY